MTEKTIDGMTEKQVAWAAYKRLLSGLRKAHKGVPRHYLDALARNSATAAAKKQFAEHEG